MGTLIVFILGFAAGVYMGTDSMKKTMQDWVNAVRNKFTGAA